MNGPPSSADYNDFCKETVSDLADLAIFVNEALIPILAALPAAAAAGLDGSTIYANPASTDPLFFNAIDASHYTVAQVLASVTNVTTSVSAKVDDMAARILALQTRLATTDQNDLRSSIQSFKDTITSISAMIATMNVAIAA